MKRAEGREGERGREGEHSRNHGGNSETHTTAKA